MAGEAAQGKANASALIGKTIGGRYTIKSTIGSGGMGHVYKAIQAPINREIAIKVLRVDLAGQEGVTERFKREAKAASLINHPNAITIFDFGEDDGILYLAMEFLSGETLRQRLRREPALTIDQALDAIESMAGALGAAHKVGVVHRDLKPDNIFIAKFDAASDVVKVLDFGLAKLLDPGTSSPEDQLTRPELRLGTPRYMAPEQALGIQPIDSRCDVYALGLLLFEMLAGRAPFTGEDGMEVLAQRLRKESPKLSAIAPNKNFSEHMDAFMARLLERDRSKRPADANEVLAQIREIRKNGQVYQLDDEQEAETLDQPPPGNFRRANPSAPGAARPGSNPGRQTNAGMPVGSRPGAQRGTAGGMISLDQDDDLADKRTVLVDSHVDLAPAQAIDPQRPVSMSQTPVIGQSHGQLQPYGRSSPGAFPGPQSQPNSDQTAPHSSSMGAPVQPKSGLRNVFIALFAIALLAPLIALAGRWWLNRGKDIEPTQPVVEPPKPKTVSDPPAPKPKVKLKVTSNKAITLKRDGSSLGTKTLFEEDIEKSDSKIHFSVTNAGCKPAEFDFVPTESRDIPIKCGKKK
ncbi:MAG TPA: serine/threonine-protein kinase [Pseudomonadota bacterium]|nr:serine/threonine-protein kinase [Pseudomonadota bacterium]